MEKVENYDYKDFSAHPPSSSSCYYFFLYLIYLSAFWVFCILLYFTLFFYFSRVLHFFSCPSSRIKTLTLCYFSPFLFHFFFPTPCFYKFFTFFYTFTLFLSTFYSHKCQRSNSQLPAMLDKFLVPENEFQRLTWWRIAHFAFSLFTLGHAYPYPSFSLCVYVVKKK